MPHSPPTLPFSRPSKNIESPSPPSTHSSPPSPSSLCPPPCERRGRRGHWGSKWSGREKGGGGGENVRASRHRRRHHHPKRGTEGRETRPDCKFFIREGRGKIGLTPPFPPFLFSSFFLLPRAAHAILHRRRRQGAIVPPHVIFCASQHTMPRVRAYARNCQTGRGLL